MSFQEQFEKFSAHRIAHHDAAVNSLFSNQQMARILTDLQMKKLIRGYNPA